ncbi:hypothetical protein CHS0354_026242 [Potamilus streckersoni]|uniref:Uncharacterized protein n=1 Tax=Potamilus streckersoni TaxID=2493646 RepID=A0AAE0TF89_9BIVA|nr:hypothetical protein CHS0354_026242 [Potamilus streckersoni]
MEMYGVLRIILTLTSYIVLCTRGQGTSCKTKGRCKCVFDDGKAINIMSLGNTDSKPRFQDVRGQDEEYYSYNPCYPFTEGDCTDAASCLIDQNLQKQIKIGNADTANFFYDAATQLVIVQYASGRLTTLVLLICDHSAIAPVYVPIGSLGPQPIFCRLFDIQLFAFWYAVHEIYEESNGIRYPSK